MTGELSRWKLLTWVTALSGPVGYALGRVVVETFYSRFDVLPSEVGLRYDSLLAPTLLVMTATAAIGALLILLGRLAAAIGGGVGVYLTIDFAKDGTLFTWRGLGLLALVLLAIGVLSVLGGLEETLGHRVWLLVLAMLAVTATTLALTAASSAADTAAEGNPTTVTLLGIPLSPIHATRVRLTGIDGPARPPGADCLLLLGSADSVTVLLDHGVVWRVPADIANTTTGC
ncbi:hypothetical protein [Actinokineospora cianjurensis]|uniref:Uncharacterized protein n=1 Tax=Actinokineospora cianjurensis TaxID=585224 RepID=A0A421B3A5_9PSEU|nr:hypothetical protein [Actinokineospora cianjurensis]RLK58859.1 hypothetical protein CLV68_3339 [Actinokineospora cianjurensis]